MAKYNIYMVKLRTAQIRSEADTGTAIKRLFDQVIQSSAALRRRFNQGSEVRWMTRCPQPASHELLIYLVSSATDSIVDSLPGLSGLSARGETDGMTAWVRSLTASEVYTIRFGSNADMLAKLVFHEAMHNKTHQGNSLHTRGGLAASPTTPQSRLTPANVRMMAAVLGNRRPQWAGGCAAYNDPLRGI